MASGVSAQSIDELHQEIRRYADLVRVEVFHDVAAHGCSDAVQVIGASLKLLETPVQRVRAIEACAAFSKKEAEDEAIELLLEVALARDADLALMASRTLLAFDGAGLAALDKVVARGRSERVRATALGGLLPYWKVDPQKEHVEHFAKHAREPYSGTERELQRWLWSVEHSLAQEAYPKLVASRSVPDRNCALLVADLARRPEAIAQPVLWKLLTSTRRDELKSVILTQVATRHLDVPVDWLKRTLRDEEHPELRYQAARILARLQRGEQDWAEILRSFAKSEDLVEQYLSAAFARSTAAEDRFTILETVLRNSEDSAVQSRAIESVYELEDPKLTQLLIENLRRLQPRARRDAQRSLALLSEEQGRSSDQDWLDWWGDGRTRVKPPSFSFEKWLTQLQHNLRTAEPDGSFFGLDLAGQNVVFILDASETMSQRLLVTRFEEETRLSYQKLVADWFRAALNKLVSKQRVSLVLHTEAVVASNKKLTKWTESAATDLHAHYMRQLPWGGGQTRLALRQAFAFEDVDTIVLVSSFGCRERLLDEYDLIVREVEQLNRYRHLTIHTVALGQKNELLIELAQKNEGQYVLAQ